MKKSASIPPADSLAVDYIFHFHQAPGRHPIPALVPPGYARIELMTGGRGWVEDREKGEWREVRAGDLLWNGEGEHTIGRSDFENPYRCLAVTVKGKVPRPAGLPRFTAAPNAEEAISFTREAVRLFGDPSFDPAVLGGYVIGRLLFWARLHQHHAGPTLLPGPLREILAWVEEHHARSCSVPVLARRAGWSPAHLHEVFRRHLGTTPHSYLLERRLRSVQERLVGTAHPVKRIAVECGFADASALGHLFRAKLGVTPKEYRKRHVGLQL